MIYKITLSNSLYGHMMPPEDSYLAEGNIFCVADGITRDPISPKDFTDIPFETALKNYPNPSGARLAADAFCQTFVKSLKSIKVAKQLRSAFSSANSAIAKLNKKGIKKVDYLVNDYFACAAIGGFIAGGKLYWGGVCDCGLAVFGRDGKRKLQTPNWMSPFQQYEKQHLQKADYNFAMPKYRKMIRSEYRNNPQKVYEGKCISYGALTGEKSAEIFMNFGELKLAKGDLIVFYSDGFEATVRHKYFFKTIYQPSDSLADQKFIPFSLSLAKQSPAEYGKERTLIAVVY